MNIKDFLSELSRVKQSGSGYKAACPGHEDTNPSLSVSENNGKIVIKCFAGCDTERVLAAVGLTTADLFAEPSALGKSRQKAPLGRVIATYDYADADGAIEYRIQRHEPKDFRAWHYDGQKWVPGLNGQKKIPYNLPAVLAADTVYVAEGEKDCESLTAQGFTATCNPFGAGNWLPAFNEYLRGKTVVIIPDNDEPGRKHAQLVAGELFDVANEVVMIELPGVKDATEYFDKGGTADQIIGMLERAESWLPETETNGPEQPKAASVIKVKKFNEWIDDAKNRPIPKKLFGDLMLQNELTIMFGPTGRGKTALAVQMTESIGSGKAIPGFDLGVSGLPVLYLDCELSDKQLEGRYSSRTPENEYYSDHFKFSDNCYRAEIDLSSASVDSPTQFQEELQRSIGLASAENDIGVVVVDNITWLRDETEKAKAALPLMKSLVGLKRRFNVSILVLAHTPKRDLSQAITLNHLQGSAVLANFADSIFAISESVKDPGLRYLKQLKVRSAEITFGAENVKTCQLIKESNFLRFEFGDETPESVHLKQLTDEDLSNRRQSIAQVHGEMRSQREIARELGISVSTVNKYVKQIEADCSQRSQGERTNTEDEHYENDE